MNYENTLEIIEQARRKVHETVDRRFDDLITLVQGGEFEIESDFKLSLCDRPTYFKGKSQSRLYTRIIPNLKLLLGKRSQSSCLMNARGMQLCTTDCIGSVAR